MICGGYDSAGYATFYAHNGARHNERICANAGKCKICNRTNKGKAKVLHISNGQQTTNNQSYIENPGLPYPIPGRNIYNGSSGEDVKWVQKFLNDVRGAGLSVDGACGNLTQNAVRSFQRDYGLTADGIVGTNTTQKMLEVWRNKAACPVGCIDSVTAIGPQKLRIQGWAFDRDDNNKAIDVHVYVGGPAGSGGAECIPIKADASRPDVDNYYNVGKNHGIFSEIKTNKTGTQDVYLYAINIGNGNDNPCIGHTTVYIEKEITLDSIYVSSTPTKTDYVKGESFNSSGLVVRAKYSDGTSKVINGYTISGFDNVGENKKLTISYEGKTTAVYVNVHIPKNNWEIISESTCSTHGEKVLKCENCSKILEREALDLSEHNWDNGIVTKEATTESDGIKTYTCIYCKKTKTESVKALNNNDKKEKQDAVTESTSENNYEITAESSSVIVNDPVENDTHDTNNYSDNYQNDVSANNYDNIHHNYIKDKCQMPYWGEGGGYLIGFETYDNPNNEYYYEMFIMDLSLYAACSPTPWVYRTGMARVPECAFWTIWQPQYGYYLTLFRLYDKDGNTLDEVCYGFANAY